MTLKDGRLPKFCYQTIVVTTAIRTAFAAEERRTAVAIYQAMTEVANERHNDPGGRDSFEAPRAKLADYAGVTKRTVDKYALAFEALGILRIERRRRGRVNLPNVWHLLDPAEAAATPGAPGAPSATVAPPPRNETHQGGATNGTGGGAANGTPVKEGRREEGAPARQPAQGAGGGRRQNVAHAKRTCPLDICDGLGNVLIVDEETGMRTSEKSCACLNNDNGLIEASASW